MRQPQGKNGDLNPRILTDFPVVSTVATWLRSDVPVAERAELSDCAGREGGMRVL